MAENIFPNIESIMYNKLISSVDLVFIAFMTCGKAQKAKQIAPKKPIIVNKIIYSNFSLNR